MSYTVQLEKSALKALKKLPESDIKLIVKEIESLKFNPRPQGCKKLKGIDNMYRLRSGNYRIVYQIQDTILLVLVVLIGDQKQVYRNL